MESVAVVALDIHKKFSKAAGMDGEGGVLWVRTVSHGGRGEMERFFGGFESGTNVVMEATFNWPWIAGAAEEAGLNVHLAHPPRARELAKGYPKSDRRDAIWLGLLWLGGKVFPKAYLAPPEVRRMRGIFRLRQALVRMRTALKNTVHGQLHRLGILVEECPDIFSSKGRRLLAELEVEECERWQLERKLSAMDDLEVQIGAAEEAILRDLEEDPRAELLMTLPGVGEILAYAILAEVGQIGRFPNGRALCAYAGVLPLDNESGEKDFGKRTSRRSNGFLRWAAIEAVSGAVRKSPRMRSLHSRVRARNKKKAGKARVAVARELLELVHLILTRRVPYMERPPARPGSDRQERRTRPNRASQVHVCARPARGQADR
jgi:transposase